MPCLVGCEADFFCGMINKTVNGDSVAPYAKLFFGDPENPDITVGNNSAPAWNNTAIIKSLQIGASDGAGVRVEVLDELGGSFHLFVEKISKCMERTKDESIMGVEWGWIVSNCDGSNYVVRSPKVYFLPIHLEVNMADGKIKFVIEGADSMQAVFAARHDDIEGDDKLKVSLKAAIIALANKKSPKFTVDFLRKEKNGTLTTFGFKEGKNGMGPEDVWDCDGQHKLATIQKWIEPFRTDRNKGIISMWDASEPGNPRLILMEDPQSDCDEGESPCSSSLGTYIVNGGNCSPVISFNPTINFVEGFAHLTTGGNSGGAGSGETVKSEKKCISAQDTQTGILQSIPVTKNAWNAFGPKNSTKESMKGQAAHIRANLAQKEIKAELRIQGDVREEFVHPKLMKDKFVSLIVINPYHIFGEDCGDWLAQPGCNEILSNRSWRVMGCDHMIKEGSFVTTLQLQLFTPGLTGDSGAPFGGPGSGGYVPTNTC